MKEMDKALAVESHLQRLLTELSETLRTSLQEQELMDGVTEYHNLPTAVTVSFSSLGKDLNLTPSYYIPAAQTDAVLQRLRTCKTATEFHHRISDMILTSQVRHGNFTISLNPKTVEVLKRFT